MKIIFSIDLAAHKETSVWANAILSSDLKISGSKTQTVLFTFQLVLFLLVSTSLPGHHI